MAYLAVTFLQLIVMLVDGVIGSVSNRLHGIGHVSITTDDLHLSTRFYTEVMGGMLVPGLSFRFYGDQHYYLMFEKEITEAQKHGLHPAELGVPDISSSGSYEVSGNFVLFDNGLIQLQTFTRRGIGNKKTAFEAREPRTSPAYITSPHICFWVKDGIDFNKYISELEGISREMGITKVIVNRPADNHNEQLQSSKKRRDATLKNSDFSDLSFVYFKGPSGEQLELYQTNNRTRAYLGQAYCRRKSVSTAFLNIDIANSHKQGSDDIGKIRGLLHFGTRASNYRLSTAFYARFLGGTLVDGSLQGTDIRGDIAYRMIFQKELLDARRLGVSPQSLGIPNLSDQGKVRLDQNVILFDNFAIKTVQYTNGRTIGDPPYNPRYNWSSPAYINNMAVAFHLHSDTDMDYYLQQLEHQARSNGFLNIHLNRCPDPIPSSPVFPTGSPLDGYRYAYMKGPSGEQLVFTQFRGRAARILQQAFVSYGAVNTAFLETNHWNSDGYKDFCNKYDNALSSGMKRKDCSLFTIIMIPFIVVSFCWPRQK